MDTTLGPASSAFFSNMGKAAIEMALEKGAHNEFMLGKVTDNDHKKDGAPLGWVKVAFHYNEQDSTHWVPVVQQGAGKNRGWFFIPEIDDEVVIGFVHGDAQHPVLLGCLWNGKDKPAGKNPGGNDTRLLKSRAGSTVTFDDKNSSITITDGKGLGTVTFDAKANKMIIQTKDGDIAFQAPQGDVKIVAKEVKVVANQKFQAKSGQDMKLSTNAAAKITGTGGKVTWSGSNHKDNCDSAANVTAPTATPVDVADPYST